MEHAGTRDVKIKSYAYVRERDVDGVSNGGRNCTGNMHGDWAMNAKRQREFIMTGKLVAYKLISYSLEK